MPLKLLSPVVRSEILPRHPTSRICKITNAEVTDSFWQTAFVLVHDFQNRPRRLMRVSGKVTEFNGIQCLGDICRSLSDALSCHLGKVLVADVNDDGVRYALWPLRACFTPQVEPSWTEQALQNCAPLFFNFLDPAMEGQRSNGGLRNTVIAGTTVAVAAAALTSLSSIMKRKALNRKLERKRASSKQTLSYIEQHLQGVKMTNEEVQSITSLEFEQLRNKLQNGQLQAVDVLHAYQMKALEANKTINCLTDAFIEAEDQAVACDRMKDKHRSLHGMPLSLKENFGVKGYDSTAGMETNIGKIMEVDAVMVQVFKLHGAIPFVKTNIPQSMYSYTCSNPIFGETSNPCNTQRAPGGSSGGEGALLGAGGSIIGLGTDVGGSVRVPAALCGVCALKPTMGRFSSKGVYTVNRGQTLLMGVTGPMARDVHSLVEMTRVMTAPDMWELDPSVPRMPFQEQLFTSGHKLRVGYYTSDGNFQSTPGVVRAVHVAKKALESLGHTCVEFSPPDYSDAYASLYVGTMVGGDGGQTLTEKLKNDRLDKGLKLLPFIKRMPRWLLGMLAYMIQSKDALQAKVLRAVKSDGTTFSWFRHVERLRDYRENFIKHWKSLNLDAVICPVYPCPAPYLKDIHEITAAGSAAALYNLVNFPAGTVPVTRVNEQDIVNTRDPNIFPAKTRAEKILKKSCASEDSKGLPLGVQCVTLPYTEELCLRLMTELEGAVDFSAK